MKFDFNKEKHKLKKLYKKIIAMSKAVVRKSWFKYAVVAFFILMILVGFLLGKVNANKSYAISNLEVALRNNNGKDLAKIINVENKNIKLNSDDVIPMIDYYGEDQSRITDLINILKNDKADYGISIKNKKHWYGEEYYVALNLKSIDVISNFPGSKVYLNNNTVGEINESGTLKVQGLVPGVYTIKVENRNKYCKLSKEDRISFVNDSSFEKNLDAIKVSIASDFTDAEVYINGEETKVLVKDFKDMGPFETNSKYKIKIKQDTPWGEIFSEEQTLNDVPVLKFNIDLNNEVLNKSIEEQILSFYKSVFEALNKEDKDIIQGATEEINDKVYNEMKKEYHFLKNDYNISDFQINMVNSEVKYDKGIYNGNIVVNVNYDISKKILGFNLNKETKEKSFFTKLQFSQGKWVINGIDKFK